MFLPVEQPVSVKAGDRIGLTLHVMPAEIMLSWKLQLPDGRVSAHSVMKGMLLTRHDLVRTRPDLVPTLTSWGEARRSVLMLCDGRTTLAELEGEVQRRHPTLFPTPRDAQRFVAEVITRYSA